MAVYVCMNCIIYSTRVSHVVGSINRATFTNYCQDVNVSPGHIKNKSNISRQENPTG